MPEFRFLPSVAVQKYRSEEKTKNANAPKSSVFVPSQILKSLWIDAFMNQIRDIGVPEKMRCHMEIQSIVDALVRSASLAKLR